MACFSLQCLLMLMDSPLNRAGLLQVYIHTEKNVLIEINPQTRIPRTFPRFCGLMGNHLHLFLCNHAYRPCIYVISIFRNRYILVVWCCKRLNFFFLHVCFHLSGSVNHCQSFSVAQSLKLFLNLSLIDVNSAAPAQAECSSSWWTPAPAEDNQEPRLGPPARGMPTDWHLLLCRRCSERPHCGTRGRPCCRGHWGICSRRSK